MWFDLKADERISQRCATEGCAGQPTARLEAGGIGSNYCSGCRAIIGAITQDLPIDTSSPLTLTLHHTKRPQA